MEDVQKPDEKPKRRTADKAEMTRRLVVVDELLHLCLTHATIQERLAREWRVTTRQVRDYIRKVLDKWAADAKLVSAHDRVAQRRGQFEGLLELAMRSKPPDLRIAAMCIDRLCRVDGCFAPERTEVVVQQDDPRAMTSDEKRKELERLFSAYAVPGPSGKGNGAVHH